MSHLALDQLDATDQLRRHAEAWDDLWRRSEAILPTARAALVAHWIEWFATDSRLRILVVGEDERMVAALPLAGRRVGRFLPAGGLTVNYWSPNGELLLDRAAPEVDEAVDLLAAAIDRLPWPLVWLDMAPVEAPYWQALLLALRRRGLVVDVHPRWNVGVVETHGDYDAYFESRSRNLRRNLRRNTERLEALGPLAFSFQESFAPEAVEGPLREVFELEDRGWKGAAGSSVLRAPGMFEFYLRQARQLAAWDDLRLAVLRHKDRPLAYDLGWIGKGVYHSFKIGYDGDYGTYGPGHLLRQCVLRACHENPAIRAVDFQGPPTGALAAWATGSYSIARVVIVPRRLAGRAAWLGCRGAAWLVRRARRLGPGRRAERGRLARSRAGGRDARAPGNR